MVALLVVNIVVVVLTPEFQAMAPSAQGAAVGRLMGSTLLALLLAYVGGVARKRNAARRAGGEAPAG